MILTDDQRQLADLAKNFLAEEGTIKQQLRHWRDTGCKDGFGHGLWKQMAELGLTGLAVPAAQGGLGLGATEAALVMEEVGRNLTPSPFLTTALVAVVACVARGTAVPHESVKQHLLSKYASFLDKERKRAPVICQRGL